MNRKTTGARPVGFGFRREVQVNAIEKAQREKKERESRTLEESVGRVDDARGDERSSVSRATRK